MSFSEYGWLRAGAATDFGGAAAGNVVCDVLQPFLLVQEAPLMMG